MNSLNVLTDLHVLESEARLRHVDELMTKSRQVSAEGPVDSRYRVQVDRIQADRDRLALDLDGLRGLPRAGGHEAAGRVEDLSSALEAIGLELEKTLAAVFFTGRK